MGSSVLLLLLAVVLLVLITSRGRKQQRRTADLQSTLAPGQRVMTTAGLYADVVEVTEKTVVLETSPGVRSTWVRAAVARRVEDGEGPLGGDPPAGAAAGTTDPTAPPAPTGADDLAAPAVDLRKDAPTASDGDAPERPER